MPIPPFGAAPTRTAPNQAAGDSSTKIANTAFVTTAVNNAIAGVNPAVAVQAATTAAANTSGFTYNNGVGGIGATFTGSVNTAVTIDGYTFTALGQRLLVKNDTQSPSGAFNGVYYVTQLQTALLAPILTRALDYDAPSDMNNTGAIPVINGTVNGSTSWVLTSQVVTVGTTPLTYAQFSINPSSIVTAVSIATANGFSGSSSGGTTPALTIVAGAITPTTVNKVTITTPATSATLTIVDGKTLTANNSITIAGTDGKTLTVSNSLTLAGTDATTMTFPASSDTVVTLAATQHLTNKRLDPRVTSTASTATLTPSWDNDDIDIITAQAAALTIANGTGTPVQGQMILIRIKDNGTARAIAYGTQYRAGNIALPTTTILSKTLYLLFGWNSTDTKADLLAYNDSF
jgi:hypothetical protein